MVNRNRKRLWLFAIVLAAIVLAGGQVQRLARRGRIIQTGKPAILAAQTEVAPNSAAGKILARARLEVSRKVTYDASYRKIAYPMGDVPQDRGACTDVVIRSMRNVGLDLQALIHEDLLSNPGAYPKRTDGHRADANIDQRRVPFQRAYLKRHALTLTTDTTGLWRNSWQPG